MAIRDAFKELAESLDEHPVIWTVVVLVFVLLSIGLTASGDVPWLGKYGPSIGQAFITLVLLPLLLKLWFWSRIKQFMYEAMANSQVARDCGIEKYCPPAQLPWSELYAGTDTILLVAISAHSVFHGEAVESIKSFLSRKETSLTVVLADPDRLREGDDFDGSYLDRRRDIERSVEVLREIASRLNSGKVKLLHFSGEFKYTLWKFGGRVAYMPHPMYGLKNHRAPIGAMLISTEGLIWQRMLASDVDGLLTIAREVSLAPTATVGLPSGRADSRPE